MARQKSVHYVNNKQLYLAMVAYIASVREAEAKGRPRPPVPNDIGYAIWLIAENLGSKGNFAGYTYLDEMKADGVENCIQYIHRFNPDRYQNPHAYFTKIIWYAFLRRIEREKKETYVKYKLSVNSLHTHLLHHHDGQQQQTAHEHTLEIHEKMSELADKFEPNRDCKTKAVKKKGVEKFIGEGDAREHPTDHPESD